MEICKQQSEIEMRNLSSNLWASQVWAGCGRYSERGTLLKQTWEAQSGRGTLLKQTCAA